MVQGPGFRIYCSVLRAQGLEFGGTYLRPVPRRCVPTGRDPCPAGTWNPVQRIGRIRPSSVVCISPSIWIRIGRIRRSSVACISPSSLIRISPSAGFSVNRRRNSCTCTEFLEMTHTAPKNFAAIRAPRLRANLFNNCGARISPSRVVRIGPSTGFRVVRISPSTGFPMDTGIDVDARNLLLLLDCSQA